MSTISKKVASTVAATVLSSLLLLGGTLAWQSISQQALNEASSEVNPGGRLHDDFNFKGEENKDIYVENFADEPIYARIRLFEYLEVGDAAGMDLENNQRYDPATGNVSITGPGLVGSEPLTAVVETKGAHYSNKGSWHLHKFDDMYNPSDPYFIWHTGGKTVYMPTFNKNKDSLQPEINGTLQGDNGLYPWADPEGGEDAYSDYRPLAVGDKRTAYEVRDADSNTDDELVNYDVYKHLDDPSEIRRFVNTKNIRLSDTVVEHVAKETQTAEPIITIDDWFGLPAEQRGLMNYWVYDSSDGWCYYSKPIPSFSATGLLLDRVEPISAKVDQDNCFYAIYVDAQFITADDIGSEADHNGFYADGRPSDKALELLKFIGVDVTP